MFMQHAPRPQTSIALSGLHPPARPAAARGVDVGRAATAIAVLGLSVGGVVLGWAVALSDMLALAGPVRGFLALTVG